MSRTNYPKEGTVTYRMVMTPEQQKHLKSLVIDLMCEMVIKVTKENQK